MRMIDTLRALAAATNSLRFNPEIDPDTVYRYEQALINLRDKLSCEMETGTNDPLTLEQLREIYAIDRTDGACRLKPVWIECKRHTPYGSRYSGYYDLIVVEEHDFIISMCDRFLYIPDYGDTWLAYRYKPEGVKT